MPLGLNFKLRHASIVFLLVQPVDAQSVNAARLIRNQIIPDDWQLANEVSLVGAIAQTQYQNGVSIMAEGNRCIFQQNIDGVFSDEYAAHEAAIRYADASRVVSYRAIGLNWLVEPDVDRPDQWLRGKFAEQSAFVPGFQPVSVKVARRQGSAMCNLTFNLEQGVVGLECNYHVELGESRAIDVIRMWQHYQKNLREDILPAISR